MNFINVFMKDADEIVEFKVRYDPKKLLNYRNLYYTLCSKAEMRVNGKDDEIHTMVNGEVYAKVPVHNSDECALYKTDSFAETCLKPIMDGYKNNMSLSEYQEFKNSLKFDEMEYFSTEILNAGNCDKLAYSIWLNTFLNAKLDKDRAYMRDGIVKDLTKTCTHENAKVEFETQVKGLNENYRKLDSAKNISYNYLNAIQGLPNRKTMDLISDATATRSRFEFANAKVKA